MKQTYNSISMMNLHLQNDFSYYSLYFILIISFKPIKLQKPFGLLQKILWITNCVHKMVALYNYTNNKL